MYMYMYIYIYIYIYILIYIITRQPILYASTRRKRISTTQLFKIEH